MNAKQYKKARLARGTVKDVALAIGVHPMTINKRERGEIPVSKEAEMSLMSLPKLKRPVPVHTRGRKPGSKNGGAK
jgi:hypothetical protein